MRALIVRCVRIVVMLFAVVIALDKFGFQVAPLVAGIGVAGLGVGLALQGVLANVVAGLSIIFTKPFRVGEYIELAGVHGQVSTIALFSTTLLHPHLSRVVIPQPEDRRRDPAQLRHDPSGPPGGQRAARDRSRGRPGRGRRGRRPQSARAGRAGPGDRGRPGHRARGGHRRRPWVKVPDLGAATAELNRALVEEFRTRRIDLGLTPETRLVDAARVGGVAALPGRL